MEPYTNREPHHYLMSVLLLSNIENISTGYTDSALPLWCNALKPLYVNSFH